MSKIIISILVFGLFLYSCSGEENKDIKKNGEKKVFVTIDHPKTAKNGSRLYYKIEIKNGLDNPIHINKIYTNERRSIKTYEGFEVLKGSKFKLEKTFFYNDIYQGDRGYEQSKIHPIKNIIQPGETKIIKLKGIAQSFDKKYSATFEIYYKEITDQILNNGFYRLNKVEKLDKGRIERKLYIKTKDITKVNSDLLMLSEYMKDLKIIKKTVTVNLTGGFEGYTIPKFKAGIMTYAYHPASKKWLFTDGVDTVIASKDGKNIKIFGKNMVRPFIKGNLSSHVKFVTENGFYEDLKEELKNYTYKNEGKFRKIVYIPSKDLMDIHSKIYPKGYFLDKHSLIMKK